MTLDLITAANGTYKANCRGFIHLPVVLVGYRVRFENKEILVKSAGRQGYINLYRHNAYKPVKLSLIIEGIRASILAEVKA